jgi:hypothetical protein
MTFRDWPKSDKSIHVLCSPVTPLKSEAVFPIFAAPMQWYTLDLKDTTPAKGYEMLGRNDLPKKNREKNVSKGSVKCFVILLRDSRHSCINEF